MSTNETNTALTIRHETEASIDKDKFGFKDKISNVSTLIQNIKGYGTIAITAPYGGGKSFFAQCLFNELQKLNNKNKKSNEKGVQPFLINLHENDYKQPLIPISVALHDKIESYSTKKLLRKSIKLILKITSTTLLKMKLDKEIDDFFDKKDVDNIQSLKNIIAKTAKNKKLVFLVDEIDRCKPEYAVEFLETIKHLFNINNVVFVLFINDTYITNLSTNYLGYGCGNEGYIEKYIDKKIILQVNYESGAIDDLYNNLKSHLSLEELHEVICYFKLTPRQLMQLRNHIELFKNLFSLHINTPIVILIIIKYFYPQDFRDIQNGTESIILTNISVHFNKTKNSPIFQCSKIISYISQNKLEELKKDKELNQDYKDHWIRFGLVNRYIPWKEQKKVLLEILDLI